MSTTRNKRLASMVVVVNWILLALFATACVAVFAVSLIIFDDAAVAFAKWFEKAQDEMETDDEKVILSDEDVLTASRLVLTIVLVVVGVFFLVYLAIELALNILLSRGVNQSDRRRCTIWLVIKLIIFILGTVGLVIRLFEISSGISTGELTLFIVDLVYLIWLGISLFIVKGLRDDLGNTPAYGGVVYSKAETNPNV